MISLFPDGTFQIKRHMCSCDNCILGLFQNCGKDNIDVISSNELVAMDETENNEPDMFLLVEVNTHVVIYSKPNVTDPFYVVKVTHKGIANEDEELFDMYGTNIQVGSQYFKGYRLEKVKEKQGKVYFKQLKKVTYVYPWDIFCPSANVDAQLAMEIGDYINLCDCLHRR